MKILTSQEIAEIEKKASENLGIPEIILMENAAGILCEEITKRFDKNTNIAFLCGLGNNGGDGFAAARKLFALGYYITVFHPLDIAKFSPAAKANFEILQKMGADFRVFEDTKSLPSYDVIVDALFGTGLKRPVNDGVYADIIKIANKAKAFKISVDIPSGLFADDTAVRGLFFKPDLTVTFTALKICQSLYPSKEHCGQTVVKNISIPEKLLADYKRDFLTDKDLPKLKIRNKDSHKGDYGRAFILGGSADMAGAVSIASIAALKIGAGLTYISVNDETPTDFINGYPEIIIKKWNLNEPSHIIDFVNSKASALLIGCGMGTNENTAEFIKEIVSGIKTTPLIIDADGINCLKIADLKTIKAPFAITPHLKEFAKLLDNTVDNVKSDRLTLAKNFAKSYKCTLVLKSADSIIATPDERLSVADFGTPALAKGGSGDSLAGTFAGLVAQNYSFEDAAKLAVFVNGRAAKYAENVSNQLTVTATDVINNFGRALNDIRI